MFRSVATLSLSAVVLAFGACGSGSGELSVAEIEAGFSMRPPNGWIEGDKARAKAIRYWLDGDAEDGLAADVAVRTFEFRGGTEPDEVARGVGGILRMQGRDYREVAHGGQRIAGRQATWMLGSIAAEGYRVELLQYLIPVGGTMIEVVFCCVEGEMYANRPIFDAAAATIRLE